MLPPPLLLELVPVVWACVLVLTVVAVDRERCSSNSPRTVAAVRHLWRAAAFVALVRLWTAVVVVPNLSVDDRAVWHATHDRMQREAAAAATASIAVPTSASFDVGRVLDSAATGEATTAAAGVVDSVWRQIALESADDEQTGAPIGDTNATASPTRTDLIAPSTAPSIEVDAIRPPPTSSPSPTPSLSPPPPPPPPPHTTALAPKRRRKTSQSKRVGANRDGGVVVGGSGSASPMQIVVDILRYMTLSTAVVVTVDALSTPDSILKRKAPGAEPAVFGTSVVCVVAWFTVLMWPSLSGGVGGGGTASTGDDAPVGDYRTAATVAARVHVLDALIIVAAVCREYATATARRRASVEVRRVEQHVSRRQQRRNEKISARKTERAAAAQSRNPKRHQCADADCRRHH